MDLSQKLFLAAALCLALVISKAEACSVSVNDKAQQNELVAKAASHLGIALSDVKEILLTSYTKSFAGGTGSSCPAYLHTQARVSFKYSPSAGENCDAQTKIELAQFMGDPEQLAGPMEYADFSELSAACSTSVVLRKPLKKPMPVKVSG